MILLFHCLIGMRVPKKGSELFVSLRTYYTLSNDWIKSPIKLNGKLNKNGADVFNYFLFLCKIYDIKLNILDQRNQRTEQILWKPISPIELQLFISQFSQFFSRNSKFTSHSF